MHRIHMQRPPPKKNPATPDHERAVIGYSKRTCCVMTSIMVGERLRFSDMGKCMLPYYILFIYSHQAQLVYKAWRDGYNRFVIFLSDRTCWIIINVSCDVHTKVPYAIHYTGYIFYEAWMNEWMNEWSNNFIGVKTKTLTGHARTSENDTDTCPIRGNEKR
jgi:hypothetical protein